MEEIIQKLLWTELLPLEVNKDSGDKIHICRTCALAYPLLKNMIIFVLLIYLKCKHKDAFA